jgi:hypothetical protein
VTAVPVVAIVEGALLMMFFNDHDPPHVDIEFAEYRAKINIATLAVMSGRLPRAKQRRILDWVGAHRKELAEAWLDVRADRKPTRIA